MAGFLQRERIVAPPGWSRWLVPPAALSIHLAIGQAYAWSVFKPPLEKGLGISGVASALPFTLGIIMLGLSAALFGTRVDAQRARGGRWSCPRLLRQRLPDFRAGPLLAAVLAGRRRLRLRRRDRAGHRLHLTGLHTDQVVPGPARPGDRYRDHGLRRRRADRVAADQSTAHRFRRIRRHPRRQRHRADIPGHGPDLRGVHVGRAGCSSACRAHGLAARRMGPGAGQDRHADHHGERLGRATRSAPRSSGCSGSCCAST